MTDFPLLSRAADALLPAAEAACAAGRLLLAIDGRCASGKTTLAELLRARYAAAGERINVLHADSFFLRPEQRTAERLAEPGGNFDRERFAAEVLTPLAAGEAFCYRPFDCKTGALADPVWIAPARVNVLEGSYVCHPALAGAYGYRAFLTVDPVEQLRRIRARNGDAGAGVFAARWIPLEERYFAALGIAARCDAVFST